MKFAMLLLASTVSLSISAKASAQAISCPDVAKIVVDGAQATVYYFPAMGFSKGTDTTIFLGKSDLYTEFQAETWGAQIVVPNDMLEGKAINGVVRFFMPETSPLVVNCQLVR